MCWLHCFLGGVFGRFRKYYPCIRTITQDVEDFMNSPYGKPIVTNAAMQLLLKQAPSAMKSLQEAFDLTEGEKYLLLNSGIGQGVFFAGRKHVALQIVASPKEHEIVTTNPEEIARRRAEAALKKQQETQLIEPLKEVAPPAPAPETEKKEENTPQDEKPTDSALSQEDQKKV